MPRPPRIQYENAFYHVMNRGRGKRWIYHTDKYYEAFLRCLEEAHDRYGSRIHAYCLMGNHYHLLIETPLANLDRIMRHINGVYTQRFNRLKRTDGPLFRGRYKSILVDDDTYLLQVSRYIHRNPLEVKGAGKEALSTYEWSSYRAYIKEVKSPEWLYQDRTYRMVGGKCPHLAYEAFVLEGNDSRTQEFYTGDCLTGIFGDLNFRQSVYDERECHPVSHSSETLVNDLPEMAAIVESVSRICGVSREDIIARKMGRQEKSKSRHIAIYCCQRLGQHKQKAIAEYFSLGHRGSVSAAVYSIEREIDSYEMKALLGLIRADLSLTKCT